MLDFYHQLWSTFFGGKICRVTETQARSTALAKVPGGRIQSAELEYEHGKLIWSFDISHAKSANVTEVQVDAKTGIVVSRKIEIPAAQANEAEADKKAAKLAKP